MTKTFFSSTYHLKVLLLIVVFFICLIAISVIEPIPQNPSFHLFADSRTCLGILNFGNTVSNIAFAFVGLWGIWTVMSPKKYSIFRTQWERWPYIVFCAGIFLVGIGSSYYHWSPNNERLFWDRLPITVAFMGFFTACLTDRLGRPNLTPRILPINLLLGMGSVVYWSITEAQGNGDLRFYLFIQYFPILLLPILCKFFPKWRHTNGKYLFWIVICYGFAVLLEQFDHWLYELSLGLISGHTLKHLFAALAAFMVIRMVTSSTGKTSCGQ
ncbi:MAG: alkaline phytoceramidase [Rhodospirillaceae bacterium]|nr:alkaline phytoceramidase [Rhodospirillaceae bacterium]